MRRPVRHNGQDRQGPAAGDPGGFRGEPFQKFKGKLNDWEVPVGYKRIPKNRLEGADEGDVASAIISFYTESHAIEVALGVLAAIGEMNAHEKLKNLSRGK
uniref:Pyrin domain-containing protein n=1 Tax=Xenopus tropicalis TaxID=8364 RepID=A0A1B8Y1J7_XENTR